MSSLNKVMLIGNLTRDPEVRHTPKGTAVGDFGLAMNSSYRAQDGTEKEEVCYVDVEVWGRQAETCKDYLSKGRQVFIEGRLQLDQWTTPQGEKRSRLRVRAERVQFLGSASGAGGSAPRKSSGYSRSSDPGDSQETPPPREDFTSDHNDDDEIPF
ncbi:MAG: single-stranded DNA-binding protein [Candidatus Methylacidiphilales bacterium]